MNSIMLSRSIARDTLRGSITCLKQAASATCIISRRYASSDRPKQTCLYNFHRARNARMEPFAGFSMPIVYKGQSIKSEHLQTRNSASAFDVSHMMQTVVRGKDMIKFVESITVTDIQGLGINKCSLSVFTNDTGGIIDDCIIGRCTDRLQIVSNAGNADLVWDWMNKMRAKQPNLDVSLERLYGQGLIALQGPKAATVLQQLTDVKLEDLKFMTTTEADLKEVGGCIITRCGYTGEDGFEISVKPDSCEKLMEMFCNDEHVNPAGLGARDTLRLEAGLCLHGHDISDKTSPIEATLAWVVHKRRRESGGFPGHSIIVDQIKNGPKIKRMGLVAGSEGGPPAREGSEVVNSAGETLGKVTSGNFAPVLNRNIAMAYLTSDKLQQQDKTVFCKVRGKSFEYHVTKMPFVKSNYYI